MNYEKKTSYPFHAPCCLNSSAWLPLATSRNGSYFAMAEPHQIAMLPELATPVQARRGHSESNEGQKGHLAGRVRSWRKVFNK